MSETLIEQMRRAWAQSDHCIGAAMYWSLTPDGYDRLRYEAGRDDISFDGQPKFMGFPIYRGGSGVPKFMLLPGEPPDDQRESELKRQLDMLMREYRRQAQPIIDELVKIENRKPPMAHLVHLAELASVDTHAKRGDSTQIEAPSPMGSAVGEAETPTRSRQSNKPGREM